VPEKRKNGEDNGWEYGDAWKDGSPDDAVAGDAVAFIEVLRGTRGGDSTIP